MRWNILITQNSVNGILESENVEMPEWSQTNSSHSSVERRVPKPREKRWPQRPQVQSMAFRTRTQDEDYQQDPPRKHFWLREKAAGRKNAGTEIVIPVGRAGKVLGASELAPIKRTGLQWVHNSPLPSVLLPHIKRESQEMIMWPCSSDQSIRKKHFQSD